MPSKPVITKTRNNDDYNCALSMASMEANEMIFLAPIYGIKHIQRQATMAFKR